MTHLPRGGVFVGCVALMDGGIPDVAKATCLFPQAHPTPRSCTADAQPSPSTKYLAPQLQLHTFITGLQQLEASTLRMVDSRKRPAADLHADAEALVTARLGVWWPADETYYRATVKGYDTTLDRHLIRYDDDAEEWLSLRSETFTWLAPRASSAGGNAAFRGALVQYGAQNVPAFSPPPPRVPSTQPREVLGHTLTVWSPVDGAMHHGEVIAYNKGHVHVLYNDGEDEVLDLCAEVVAWVDQAPSGSSTPSHATRSTTRTPARKGRPPRVSRLAPIGTAAINLAGGAPSHTPTRKAAVGWRVALHDAPSMCFVQGVVGSYYPASNTYRVKFDSGGAAVVSLKSHRIKWLFPPSSVCGDTDDSEAANDSAMTHHHDTPCCSHHTGEEEGGEVGGGVQQQKLKGGGGGVQDALARARGGSSSIMRYGG